MADLLDDRAWRWRTATTELVARTRFITPSRLPEAVAVAAAVAGSSTRMYLVDHEQHRLRPFPPEGDPLHVEATPAGTAFRTTTPEREGAWLWNPLLDGSERLGVLGLDATAAERSDPAVRVEVDRFVALVGHLIAVMSVYGDAFEHVRRTRPMSAAAGYRSALATSPTGRLPRARCGWRPATACSPTATVSSTRSTATVCRSASTG
jgi:hypothetical protein